MLLQSFLRSSRLEILLSKQFMVVIYLVFGLLVLVWWAFDSIQFIEAYQTLRAYDVSITTFFLIEILLFTPLFLVGCFLLRSVLQRIRLQRWFKNQTNIPLYASMHSPAVAGYLVDYEFGLEEAYATLLDLHFRGNITIVEQQTGGFVLSLINVLDTTGYERIFLRRLFAETNELHIVTLADPLLLRAAKKSHDYLMQQLQSEGFLPLTKHQDKKFRPLVRLVYWVAGSVAMLAMYAFIFDREVVTAIGHPRYAVTSSQLWLVGLISTLGLGVIISGFWPKFAVNSKGSPSAGWLAAAGFKHYLQTVFLTRLSLEHIHLQDKKTIRLYAPYLIAFRLVRLNSSYLRAVLQSQKASINT